MAKLSKDQRRRLREKRDQLKKKKAAARAQFDKTLFRIGEKMAAERMAFKKRLSLLKKDYARELAKAKALKKKGAKAKERAKAKAQQTVRRYRKIRRAFIGVGALGRAAVWAAKSLAQFELTKQIDEAVSEVYDQLRHRTAKQHKAKMTQLQREKADAENNKRRAMRMMSEQIHVIEMLLGH